METIAIYWEAKIRTYGVNLLEGLTLYRLAFNVDQVGQWSHACQEPCIPEAAFRLVWYQMDGPGRAVFRLVCDDPGRQAVEAVMAPFMKAGTCAQTPVDIIFFQGPHYGDRYGIMDFTYQALAQEHISLVGAVCSVATIYLVVPAGQGRAAVQLLTQAFDIPKSADRKGPETKGGRIDE
jgi:hypothetical protein